MTNSENNYSNAINGNYERDMAQYAAMERERRAKQDAKHYNVFEAAGAAAFGAMAAKFLFGRRG